MAGLNVCGLQSTVASNNHLVIAIIIIIILQVSLKSLHVLWAWLQ